MRLTVALFLVWAFLPGLAAAQYAVTSFTLINADSDQPIAGFDPLPTGTTLDLAALPTRNLNIRANTTGAPGSVRFALNANTNFHTDDAPPFALAGDTSGNYAAWTPAVGSYKLTATPYRMTRARGPAGTALSIGFTVVDSAAPVNQPPVVNAGSDQAITLPSTTVTLNGSATDDGLPGGTLTVAWSMVSGPAAVSFGTPNAPSTTATFASAGVYVLRLTANDGQLSASDDVTITVVSAGPANQPPVVNAGSDQAITLPSNTVTLHGSASDDGLPGGTLTVAWSMVSGPVAVSFGTPNAASTTATFASAGIYVLRLTANDGQLTSSDDVTVTVNAAGGTGASVVRINAGGGSYVDTLARTWLADTHFVGGSLYSTTAPIAATADDPLYQTERYGTNFSYQIPLPNGTYQVDLHFAELYFSAPKQRVFDVFVQGTLVLDDVDLVAIAGPKTATVATVPAEVTNGVLNINFAAALNNAKISAIEVRQASPGGNLPPVVSAGPDQAITLPSNTVTLNGSATDDGLPGGTLTVAWSMVSGPAAVSFGTPNAASTTATFATAGVYVLRLTANDGQLSAIDDVTVTVNAAGGTGPSVVRINAGGGSYIDTLGRTWLADTHFVGGSLYSTTAPIAATADDPLYQTERYGTNFSYQIPLPNGTYQVDLHFAELYFSAPKQRVFDVFVQGNLVLDDVDLVAIAGPKTATVATVSAEVTNGVLNINFAASVNNAKISAIEVRGHEHTGDPYLHVVIDAPAWVVDYQGTGSVDVALKGSGSHTHELGRQLASWTWKEGSVTLGTSADIVKPLALGNHTVSLTIADNNNPPRTLTGTATIDVYPFTAVGGALARYYPAGGIPLATLLDAPPATPGFMEVLPSLAIDSIAGRIGGSPFTSDTLVVLTGTFHAASSGTYAFLLQGGSGTRLFVNGGAVSGPTTLGAGSHALEARFAVPSLSQLPASVSMQLNGGPVTLLGKANTTHDHTSLPPFINAISGSSGPSGGNPVTIKGLGFFPSGSVTVIWDGAVLGSGNLSVAPDAISLLAPAGTGTISVQVQTPNGLSNSVDFTYLTGGGTVGFSSKTVATPASPTRAAWGPDGRLYVGTITGHIHAYTFNANYDVTNVQTIATLSTASNPNILGIAFNPFDPPSPVKIYVAHSLLFAHNNGTCFSGPSPYNGQVSVLTGAAFSTVQPLITGLPVSNHDHGVNGMAFDNEGDLLIALGGNTNAGIVDCDMGGLPESPLSAAIVKARISKPGFNGAVQYVETSSGAIDNSQTAGQLVDVAAGVDVSVFAAGLRNPFDIVWTTNGRLYGTDNGPNAGFGAASTSATTQTSDPTAPDEILALYEGHYYGHPNRNRGRRDNRQNIYRAPTTASLVGLYTAPLGIVPASTNGIDEYRSMAFGGALRGNLLVQHWNGALYRAQIAENGSISTIEAVPGVSNALDVVAGPGGAIVGIDYSQNAVKVFQPQSATSGMQAHDIFPWRARPDTPGSFAIGGLGFGSTASVTIGGTAATVTSVTPTRILGTLPAKASPTTDLLDVVVQSAGVTSVISKAFRYVLPSGLGTGSWQAGVQLPVALGEVAAGAANGVIYLVGHSTTATLGYDLAQNAWISGLPQRPFVGDHHAAEVIDGKLYLFGGIGGGSEGKVQIFNPQTNTWTTGANVPFATGSASTALINGKVYLAGGIVGSSTTTAAAVYNPLTNTWSSIASMPLARNHTAAGTDGQRLFIFGGRGPGSGDGNVVAEGFDDVQIFDPGTNSWISSSNPNSGIPPLPQKRGGMGKAAFFGGEFYVIGGETTSSGTGQVAGNVYNRVDVYNPVTKTWRLETPLPTARHGIFPLAVDGKIFVPGGGTQAGHSESKAMEIFAR